MSDARIPNSSCLTIPHRQTVNLLTGPPQCCNDDHETIKRFLQRPGIKIVCGGTTARLVANYLRVPLTMESELPAGLENMETPPRYGIQGIHLATEGLITLNQVYNSLEEDRANFGTGNTVGKMLLLLDAADELNIVAGLAQNSANTGMLLRQRKELIGLLAEKLRREGKLVNVEFV